MKHETISVILAAAIDATLESDGDLLDLGVTERALSHQIAVKLVGMVPQGFAVDCEYNRHLEDIKRLNLPHRDAHDRDVRARTVFPDIIVHRRNSDADNLLVVELKKPGEDTWYDELKLQAFRHELHYQHAALVILGLDGDGQLIREVIWFDN